MTEERPIRHSRDGDVSSGISLAKPPVEISLTKPPVGISLSKPIHGAGIPAIPESTVVPSGLAATAMPVLVPLGQSATPPVSSGTPATVAPGQPALYGAHHVTAMPPAFEAPVADAARVPPVLDPRTGARSARPLPLLVAGVGIAVVVLAGAAFMATRTPTAPTAAPATTKAPAPVPSTTTVTTRSTAPTVSSITPAIPAPVEDPNVVAVATLEQAAAKTKATVPWQGRYVAQLASKAVGITDPLQTAANGTHVFYESDILAEHEALVRTFAGYQVVLLKSTDYGSRDLWQGKPLYRTFVVDASFVDGAAVRDWCAAAFVNATTQVRENSCLVRALKP